jgi:hypothetical protein
MCGNNEICVKCNECNGCGDKLNASAQIPDGVGVSCGIAIGRESNCNRQVTPEHAADLRQRVDGVMD